MSADSEATPPGLTFAWPWPIRLAPAQLTQPINPGWSFGNLIVNSTNSTAPDIEQQVVGKHSYGRQIGRMMDALSVLVARLPPTVRDTREIAGFVALVEEVDAIKEAGKAARLARLRGELEALKQEDLAAWKKLTGAR